MNVLRSLITLSLICTVIACSSIKKQTEPVTLTIKSRDWINASMHDIHADLTVRKIDDRLYRLNYSFEIPLDPQTGINPSEFHYFTFCVASRLSYVVNKTYWSIGTLNKADLKYKNTKTVELVLATLNNHETRPVEINNEKITWLDDASSREPFYDMCSKILRTQYMWPKN